MRHRPLTAWLLALPALAVFAFYITYPLIHTVVLSGYSWSALQPARTFEGLGNYVELARDPVLRTALLNNGLWIVLSLVIQLPVAMLLAVGIGSALRRHRILRTVYFSPLIVPAVAVGLIWTLFYDPNFGALNAMLEAFGLERWTAGWLGDTKLATLCIIVVSCWRYTGFHMMILLAGLQAIPDDIYEAALIDGAGAWRTFWHITLPLMKRIVLVDALLITVGSVKIFDLIWVMTGGGPNRASEVLATYMYRTAFSDDRMGYAAAIATVMLVLTMIATVVYLRLTQDEEASG
ncbi:MAG: carbohydrate ABC transporter permease [Armatimonadota bacterium]|jgi:raffinose/stachyose/melibiose transport system permease protein